MAEVTITDLWSEYKSQRSDLKESHPVARRIVALDEADDRAGQAVLMLTEWFSTVSRYETGEFLVYLTLGKHSQPKSQEESDRNLDAFLASVDDQVAEYNVVLHESVDVCSCGSTANVLVRANREVATDILARSDSERRTVQKLLSAVWPE